MLLLPPMATGKTILLIGAIFLAAFLFGQARGDDLLDFDNVALLDTYSYEWVMHSNNASGTGQLGETWLYNTKTGKVYRLFEQCGPEGNEDGQAGCLIALPVWTGDRLGDYAPHPRGSDFGERAIGKWIHNRHLQLEVSRTLGNFPAFYKNSYGSMSYYP